MDCPALSMKYETEKFRIQKILTIFAVKDPEGIRNFKGQES